jgi:hypothetical protein
LYTPPPPGYVASGAQGGPVGFDPVASSIRSQVVDRLVRMSIRHGGHAWRCRRDRPVAPHAIGFFYADPARVGADGRQFFTVVAATRMVNDEPGVRDLPRLLYRLAALARDRYLPTPGGFDPATQMTTHQDRSSGVAQYIGLGVSTLDTPAGSWDEVQATAADQRDIPGRCYALLLDHTAILVDRGAARETFGAVAVRSTGDLNVAPGVPDRMWIHHPNVASMPAPADVWERMYELHALTLHQPRRPTL